MIWSSDVAANTAKIAIDIAVPNALWEIEKRLQIEKRPVDAALATQSERSVLLSHQRCVEQVGAPRCDLRREPTVFEQSSDEGVSLGVDSCDCVGRSIVVTSPGAHRPIQRAPVPKDQPGELS